MRVLIYNELNPAKVPGLAKVQAALEAGHFALEQALIDPKYARERLGRIYPMLTPDNIAIQAEGRLMPLDQRLMEFFLLHLCSTLFYRYLGPALAMPRGGDAFTAPMLAHCVAHLPDSVLPTRRKQRAYISSIRYYELFNLDDLGIVRSHASALTIPQYNEAQDRQQITKVSRRGVGVAMDQSYQQIWLDRQREHIRSL